MDSIEEKLGTEDGHVLNAGVYTNFPFKPKKSCSSTFFLKKFTHGG